MSVQTSGTVMGSNTGDGRGLASNPLVVLLAIVAIAGVAVGGMAMADDGAPPAEEILANAEAGYDSAETIVGSATVTAGNETANRSVDVAFALTEDDESRLSMTADNRTIVVGSNGTVAWIHDERTGLTHIAEIPEYDESANASGDSWNSTLKDRTETLSRNATLEGWNGSLTDWNRSLEDWNESEHPWAGVDEYHNESHGGLNGTALRAVLWDWTAENTTAERVGAETVEGVETHVIEIEPEAERHNGTVTVWIGTEDGTLRKAELARDDRALTVTFSEVRFNVSVADSTFEPPGTAAPDGVTIVDTVEELNASAPFDVPRLADDAYEFTGGSTVVYGNTTAAIGEYAGAGNVTLVTASGDGFPVRDRAREEGANTTEIEIAGVTATLAETDRGVSVSWTEDGLRHAVVSDRSRAATIELAEAVIEAG